MNTLELLALLASEIERRLPDVGSDDPRRTRNALHSLRGSSALAGQADLSLVIAHFSARLRAGDADAAAEVAAILAEARERLAQGQPAFATRWPAPPVGLGPSELDPRYRHEYLTAAEDRLAELHQALDANLPPNEATARAARAVHSLKGAAGSIGDDATTWYCHGLEAALRRVEGDEAAQRALLLELPRHATALALLVEDPVAALEALRGRPPSAPRHGRPPSAPPHGLPGEPGPGTGSEASPPPRLRKPSAPPVPDDDGAEHTVRVQGASLDRVLDRLERIRLVHDDLAGISQRTVGFARELRSQRASLADALRMLGPPRPWGPPAAALLRIEGVARELERSADGLSDESEVGRAGVERLRVATSDIRRELGQVRRTTLSAVVARVASGLERLAARDGRAVRVPVMAVDAPIDRDVAERLVDPLMQLGRNALAHGIEPPEQRERAGKDPVGTIAFTAEREGDWLRISCDDDGRGVDLEAIRRAAVERELVTEDTALTLSADDLLGVLFVPGLTTRTEADVLAGRGVGLDLSLSLVRRLGGSIRLAPRRPSGFSATIRLPSERWLADVLWVEAGRWSLALPVHFTGRITRADRHRPPVHLCRCLGEPSPGHPALSIELALDGVPTVSVGIDALGEVEECSLRPLPSAVAAAGPFSGAIVRGDGALHLALDATLLAVRAWSLA